MADEQNGIDIVPEHFRGLRVLPISIDAEAQEAAKTYDPAQDNRPAFQKVQLHPTGNTIQSAPELTVGERLKRVATENIPRYSTRTVHNPKYGKESFLAAEELLSPEQQHQQPVLTGALEGVSDLVSPGNVAIGAATAGLGEEAIPAARAIQRLISAGFSADMLHSAYQQVPELKAALISGDFDEAQRIGMHILTTGGMGIAAGAHALEGRPEGSAFFADRQKGAVKFGDDVPEKFQGLRVVKANASGESAASQEAINRVSAEKDKGVQRVKIDTRSGKETPLNGVDAVDSTPQPHEVIVLRDANGETLLDKGAKAKYTPPVAEKTPTVEPEPGVHELNGDEPNPITINPHHETKGLPPINLDKVEVDKPTVEKVADAYDALQHSPDDPKVKAAYNALIKETKEQWKYAQDKLGMTMEVTPDQPYQTAEEMHKDIRENKRIKVWGGEGDMPEDHPLHAVDPETGLSHNTLFRAVHDVFGHAAGGHGFDEVGEENAFNLHRQSYSKEAIPALATETRGQASWFFNNKAVREGAELGNFPPQKAALMPEDLHRGKAASSILEALKKTHGESSDASGVTRGASFITPEGKFIHLGMADHNATLKKHGYDPGTSDNRVSFINDSGAIRTNFRTGREGKTLHVSVPRGGVTEVQVQALKDAYLRGVGKDGHLVIETADNPTTIRSKESKGYPATANDVEPFLREIGSHPASRWHEKTAARINEQTAGAVDPTTGKSDTTGHGVEVYPESRQRLDHQPTAEDLQAFYEKNKKFFEEHPKLRVGWDKDPDRGWEINVGASTKSRAGAEWVGRKLDQRAAFDIEKQEEIPTGGKNEKTSFPRYNLEQRMKDLSGETFEEIQKREMPTVDQLRSAIRVGRPFSEWWPESREAVKKLVNGDDEAADEVGQFISAVSAHKPNENALHIAMNAWADWVEQGRPTGPEVAMKLLKKYESDGAIISGAAPRTGVDVSNLNKFINGHGSLYGKDVRAAKLAQEGLVFRGDDAAVVLDAHMSRLFGVDRNLRGDAYFAAKDLVTKAAEAEGLSPAAAQAAAWAVGRLFGGRNKISVDEALTKIGRGDILQEGESYVNLILEDEQVRAAAERVINRMGGDVDATFRSLEEISGREKPGVEESKKEAANPVLKRFAQQITGEKPSAYEIHKKGTQKLAAKKGKKKK